MGVAVPYGSNPWWEDEPFCEWLWREMLPDTDGAMRAFLASDRDTGHLTQIEGLRSTCGLMYEAWTAGRAAKDQDSRGGW